MEFKLLPNFEGIKEKLGVAHIGALTKCIKTLTKEQQAEFLEKKQLEVTIKVKGQDETLTLNSDLVLEQGKFIHKEQSDDGKWVYCGDYDIAYELDIEVTESLKEKYLAREITNRIQKSRKDGKLKISDTIVIALDLPEGNSLRTVVQNQTELIQSIVKKPVVLKGEGNYGHSVFKCTTEVEG